jgi:uncharacterized protein YndB with AHSA1/START domain
MLEMEFVSRREMSASRAVVFRAFTDADLLARWWGPTGFSSTFEVFDVRPGGAWRFVMRGPDGAEYAIENEFVEIAAPERIVIRHVEEMHNFCIDATFTDAGGGTLVTWRTRFESEAEADRVRDVWDGLTEQNLNRLEAIVARR